MTSWQHPHLVHTDAWATSCTACAAASIDQVSPAYPTSDQLWTALDDLGWTRRDDGRVLCRLHSAVADCDRDGHRLSPWTQHPIEDDLEWRFCIWCGARFEQRIVSRSCGQPDAAGS